MKRITKTKRKAIDLCLATLQVMKKTNLSPIRAETLKAAEMKELIETEQTSRSLPVPSIPASDV